MKQLVVAFRRGLLVVGARVVVEISWGVRSWSGVADGRARDR